MLASGSMPVKLPPVPASRTTFAALFFTTLALGLLAISSPVRAVDWQYRIRPGDTLWDLTALHLKPGTDWRRLQRHNRIADPYRLAPGTRLRVPVPWMRVQPKPALVVAVRGTVVARGSTTGSALAVTRGKRLGIGAVLETGADASVTVEFADRSRMRVLANSSIQFDELSAFGATGMVDTRMRLRRGRVSNEVTPAKGPASRYIIETPSATTSVRGTRFRVATDESGALAATEVLEGRVAVRTEDTSLELTPGFGSRVGAGGETALSERLLPAPTWLAETNAASAPVIAEWIAVPGAVRYRLEILSGDDATVSLYEGTTAATRLPLPSLPPGPHVASIRGIADTGLEGLEARTPWTVPPGPPAPIAVRMADPRGRVFVPRPRFAWARSAHAATYRLQVARDHAFGDLAIDVRLPDTLRFRPDADLAPGSYWWRVHAYDAQGIASMPSNIEAFEILPPETHPLEIASSRSNRVLRWQASQHASGYRVQLARDAGFASPSIDREVAEPQIELTGVGGGHWFVRVQAIEDDGYAQPFQPTQLVLFPCRWCKLGVGVGAAAILILAL